MSFQLSSADIYRCSVRAIARRFWWFLLLMGVAALSFVITFWTTHPPWTIQATLASLFLFVFLPYAFLLSPYLAARKLVRKNPELQGPSQYRFSDAGVEIHSPSTDGRMKWSGFVEIRETRQQFLFYPQKAVVHVLPKRSFASDSDIAAFRQLVRTCVPKAKLQK